MRLDWAVACRYAERAADDSATIVGAGLDSLWVREAPAPVTLVIAMRLAGHELDLAADVEHELTIELLGPDLAVVAEATVPFRGGPPPPEHEPGWELARLLVLTPHWVAEQAGTYSLEAHVDSRRLKSIPIVVRELPQEA